MARFSVSSKISGRSDKSNLVSSRLSRKSNKSISPLHNNDDEIPVPELPQELLVKIFAYYVKTEGVSKLLSRVSRVCRSWKEATSYLNLYTVIDDPKLGRKQLLYLYKSGLLTSTSELNLSCISLEKNDLVNVIRKCNRLKSLDLSNNVAFQDMFELIAINCPNLESLRLERLKSRAMTGLSLIRPILDTCGPKLTCLDLSNSAMGVGGQVLGRISEVCHSLEELHVKLCFGVLRCIIRKLQNGCPKLKILELGSCEYVCSKAGESCGFKHLEVFLTGVVDCHGPHDNELSLLLRESSDLRILDVRGCQVTGESLLRIPTDKMERLYLSRTPILNTSELSLVVSKWKYTLKELDFSRMMSDSLISLAFNYFLRDNPKPVLQKLDLSATTVSVETLSTVLDRFEALEFLNVESCRNLPRGTKRVYHSQQQVRKLYESLLDGDTECESHDSDSKASRKKSERARTAAISYKVRSSSNDDSAAEIDSNSGRKYERARNAKSCKVSGRKRGSDTKNDTDYNSKRKCKKTRTAARSHKVSSSDDSDAEIDSSSNSRRKAKRARTAVVSYKVDSGSDDSTAEICSNLGRKYKKASNATSWKVSGRGGGSDTKNDSDSNSKRKFKKARTAARSHKVSSSDDSDAEIDSGSNSRRKSKRARTAVVSYKVNSGTDDFDEEIDSHSNSRRKFKRTRTAISYKAIGRSGDYDTKIDSDSNSKRKRKRARTAISSKMSSSSSDDSATEIDSSSNSGRKSKRSKTASSNEMSSSSSDDSATEIDSNSNSGRKSKRSKTASSYEMSSSSCSDDHATDTDSDFHSERKSNRARTAISYKMSSESSSGESYIEVEEDDDCGDS